MRVQSLLVALFVLGAASSWRSAIANDSVAWLTGYWHLVADEDKTPPDWNEFRTDGAWINIAPNCSTFEGRWHVFDGDVYLTTIVPGKGPIALVFRPSVDKRQLTFTSPRSRNNSVMEKVDSVDCGEKAQTHKVH
jgi:hypothetical protein